MYSILLLIIKYGRKTLKYGFRILGFGLATILIFQVPFTLFGIPALLECAIVFKIPLIIYWVHIILSQADDIFGTFKL